MSPQGRQPLKPRRGSSQQGPRRGSIEQGPRHDRPRASLKPHERLRTTREFRAVYAARARAADGRLVVYVRPNPQGATRLGVSVGRRSGGAVQRNRTKRLLRETFRRARADLPGGYDVVIVTLGRDYTFEEVDRRIRSLVPEAVRRYAERTRSTPSPGKAGGT